MIGLKGIVPVQVPRAAAGRLVVLGDGRRGLEFIAAEAPAMRGNFARFLRFRSFRVPQLILGFLRTGRRARPWNFRVPSPYVAPEVSRLGFCSVGIGVFMR